MGDYRSEVDKSKNPCSVTTSCYNFETRTCSAPPQKYSPFTEESYVPEPDCGDQTSAPVHVSNGSKTISEVDFAPSGNSLLEFTRVWESLGVRRWNFSFRQKLLETTSASKHYVRIFRNSGWVVRFVETGGVWAPQANVKDTLSKDNGNWLYIMSSGDKEWFDTSGRLIRVLKADGRGITIGYSTPNVAVLTDDYGNIMTLNLDSSSRVISMTDPDSAEYKYKYNTNGDLQYVSYPDNTPGAAGSNPWVENNPYREYHYDLTHAYLITGITDENGDRYKTINYDAQGRAIESGLFDGSIGKSKFNYDNAYLSTDPRITVTNPLGKDLVYHLENQFDTVKIVTVEGVAQPSTGCLADVQSKTYYPLTGWVERQTDKAGSVTYYEYYTDTGRNGLLKKRVESEGSAQARTFTFDWDSTTRRQTQEILSGQKQTDYTYHPNGKLHIQTETDLTGLADVATRIRTITYAYYNPGTDTQVATMTVDGPRLSPIIDTTVTEYSLQGYITKSTNAKGHMTQYQNHNGRGQPGRVVDANGVITDLTYTPRGWLNTITQDVGGINAVTILEYDNVGQLTGTTLADGVHVDFRFDAAHRLYEIENGLGEIIKYELDAAGNHDEIVYKKNASTVVQSQNYDFDGLSRIYKEFGSYGQEISYRYDEKDHLTTINDGVNPATIQDFDAQNRLKQVTDADGKDMFIEYDVEDRVKKVTDQRNLNTTYVYDGFGNIKQVTSPDSGITQYTYDEAGNGLRQTDARGVVTNYSYDAMNRLKTITYPAEPSKNVTYTYDNVGYCFLCNGRLSAVNDASGVTTYFYDVLGRVDLRNNSVKVSGASSVSLTTDFTYNPAGRLTQVQYPNGQIVKYNLDAVGQVAQVTRQDSTAAAPVLVASAIKHQPFGLLKDMQYGNNLQMNRSYDLDGRLTTQTIAGKQNLIYDYNAVNNISDIANQVDPARSETYTYDPLNRLDTATGKYGVIGYDYDEVGNRTQRTLDRGGQLTTETYIYPQASNRLERIDIQANTGPVRQRQFIYDSAGNLVDETRADGSHMRPHYDNTNRMDSVAP